MQTVARVKTAVKPMLRLEFSLFRCSASSASRTWPSSTRSRSSSTPGLNVLTGETGAGKSILVEAVGLLLGGRASGDLVRTGEETRQRSKRSSRAADEELLVRREITAQGRSRAFVNGALATAGALEGSRRRVWSSCTASTSTRRCSIPSTHLDVLDAFGGLEPLPRPCRAAFDALRRPADELAASAARRRRPRRAPRARDVPAERARARTRARRARSRAKTRSWRRCGRCSPAPSASSGSATRATRRSTRATAPFWRGLGGVWRRVARAGGARPAVPAVPRRARRHQVAARGPRALPAALRRRHRRVARAAAAGRGPAGAARAPEAEVRPDARRRHRAARRASARARRAASSGDERVARARARARRGARRVSSARARRSRRARRRRSRPTSRAQLERLLARAGDGAHALRGAVRRRRRSRKRRGRARGIDAAEFFVSPNPGEDLRPLARIVSGGELSRIMLALKTLTATSRHGFSDADRSPAERGGARADLRRGRRRHRRARRRRRRPEAARARLGVSGAVHHAPAADRRVRRHALPDREARRRQAHRDDRRAARPGRARRGDRRGCSAARRSPSGLRASAREMLRRTRGRGRKAKGESERRKRKAKAKVAKTRERAKVPSGAQVPDRDVRLPDERPRLRAHGRAARAGRLRADRRTRPTPTSSSSTPAACASAPRRSSTRGSASCASWRAEQGHDPIVAVAGCVAQQEGEAHPQARRPASPTSSSARRPSAGCRCSSSRRRRGATRAGRRRPQPVRRRDVSARA